MGCSTFDASDSTLLFARRLAIQHYLLLSSIGCLHQSLLRILYSWASQHSRVAARLLAETSHVVDVPRPPRTRATLAAVFDAPRNARLVRGRVELNAVPDGSSSDAAIRHASTPSRRFDGGSAAPSSHRRRPARGRSARRAVVSPSKSRLSTRRSTGGARRPPAPTATPPAPRHRRRRGARPHHRRRRLRRAGRRQLRHRALCPPPARLPRVLLVYAHRRVDCMSVIEIDVDGNGISIIGTLSAASSDDTIAWYANVWPHSFAECVRERRAPPSRDRVRLRDPGHGDVDALWLYALATCGDRVVPERRLAAPDGARQRRDVREPRGRRATSLGQLPGSATSRSPKTPSEPAPKSPPRPRSRGWPCRRCRSWRPHNFHKAAPRTLIFFCHICLKSLLVGEHGDRASPAEEAEPPEHL